MPTFRIPEGFGSEFRPEPAGEAGRVLIGNAEAVFRQWVETAEIVNGSIDLVIAGSASDGGDDMPCVSTALDPEFHVEVRYKYIGKMKSVPYPFDD